MGEPGGIGGEIAMRAWLELSGRGPCFFLLDDPERIERLSEQLCLSIPIKAIREPSDAGACFPSALPILPLGRRVHARAGSADPATADAVVESIREAVRHAQAGRAAALVTNPIQKSALYASGFKFPGHTEYLGALAGVERPVMMLASPELRVVPLTVHVALADVPRLVTTRLIVETGLIVNEALMRFFAVGRPRIAVAGLNPHAGEEGSMGTEDRDVIAPAIAELRAEGIEAFGPVPADTMFHPRARAKYDVAICMYHDQALIPIKTIDFDRGVNVTLGLPFVRTSPDHGTALDIAGTGKARADSLIAALEMAAAMAANCEQAEGG